MLTGSLPLGRFELPSRIKKRGRRFDKIVEKCLNTSPAQRYPEVKDLLKDLISFRDYVPVSKGFIRSTVIVLAVLTAFTVYFYSSGPEIIEGIKEKTSEKTMVTDPDVLKMLPDKLPHEMIDPHLPVESKSKGKASEKVPKVSKKEKG